MKALETRGTREHGIVMHATKKTWHLLIHSEMFFYVISGVFFLLCLAVFGSQMRNAEIRSFPDTVSYQRTAGMIQNLEWIETRKAYRGQTYPLAYLLSVSTGISYALVALIMNVLMCIVAIFFIAKLHPLLRWTFFVALALGFTSHGSLDYMTTYLTESLIYSFLGLAVAIFLWCGIAPQESVRVKAIKTVIGVSAIVLFNSLKPWLLLFPIVFVLGYAVLYLARQIHQRGGSREGIRRTLTIGIVGILIARIVYAPGPDETPSKNAGVFLKNYRSDLYVQELLKEKDLSSSRRETLMRAHSQARLCVDDPTFGCLNSPLPAVRATFRDIYLSDFTGIQYLLNIFFARWRNNLQIGQSERSRYGSLPLIGHQFFSRAGPFLRMTVFLFLMSACVLGGRAIFSKKGTPDTSTVFCLAVSLLPLYAFLAVGSGRSEMGRVEMPAYYLYLLLMPIVIVQTMRMLRDRRLPHHRDDAVLTVPATRI